MEDTGREFLIVFLLSFSKSRLIDPPERERQRKVPEIWRRFWKREGEEGSWKGARCLIKFLWERRKKKGKIFHSMGNTTFPWPTRSKIHVRCWLLSTWHARQPILIWSDWYNNNIQIADNTPWFTKNSKIHLLFANPFFETGGVSVSDKHPVLIFFFWLIVKRAWRDPLSHKHEARIGDL